MTFQIKINNIDRTSKLLDCNWTKDNSGGIGSFMFVFEDTNNSINTAVQQNQKVEIVNNSKKQFFGFVTSKSRNEDGTLSVSGLGYKGLFARVRPIYTFTQKRPYDIVKKLIMSSVKDVYIDYSNITSSVSGFQLLGPDVIYAQKVQQNADYSYIDSVDILVQTSDYLNGEVSSQDLLVCAVYPDNGGVPDMSGGALAYSCRYVGVRGTTDFYFRHNFDFIDVVDVSSQDVWVTVRAMSYTGGLHTKVRFDGTTTANSKETSNGGTTWSNFARMSFTVYGLKKSTMDITNITDLSLTPINYSIEHNNVYKSIEEINDSVGKSFYEVYGTNLELKWEDKDSGFFKNNNFKVEEGINLLSDTIKENEIINRCIVYGLDTQNKQIQATYEDVSSISSYGLNEYPLRHNNVTTHEDAYILAKGFVNKYKSPTVSGNVSCSWNTVSNYNTDDLFVNYLDVIISTKGINSSYTPQTITWSYPESVVHIQFDEDFTDLNKIVSSINSSNTGVIQAKNVNKASDIFSYDFTRVNSEFYVFYTSSLNQEEGVGIYAEPGATGFPIVFVNVEVPQYYNYVSTRLNGVDVNNSWCFYSQGVTLGGDGYQIEVPIPYSPYIGPNALDLSSTSSSIVPDQSVKININPYNYYGANSNTFFKFDMAGNAEKIALPFGFSFDNNTSILGITQTDDVIFVLVKQLSDVKLVCFDNNFNFIYSATILNANVGVGNTFFSIGSWYDSGRGQSIIVLSHNNGSENRISLYRMGRFPSSYTFLGWFTYTSGDTIKSMSRYFSIGSTIRYNQFYFILDRNGVESAEYIRFSTENTGTNINDFGFNYFAGNNTTTGTNTKYLDCICTVKGRYFGGNATQWPNGQHIFMLATRTEYQDRLYEETIESNAVEYYTTNHYNNVFSRNIVPFKKQQYNTDYYPTKGIIRLKNNPIVQGLTVEFYKDNNNYQLPLKFTASDFNI